MQITYQRPRGTQDLLPDTMDKWNYIEDTWRAVAHTYGFREIVTPMFESTELFVRGAGETSDIVSKEMYNFKDRGGRDITLRPEGTAPVMRAYFENKMYTLPQPVKLYYTVPMFRYERPQAGRFRQHTQFGAEIIGSPTAFSDVEIIWLIVALYQKLGVQGIKLNINSVGDHVCRPQYREKLLAYLHSVSDHLCDEDRERMDRNPLRVLDCKKEQCQPYLQAAPGMVDYLCDPCREHFEEVQRLLRESNIEFVINPRLVRGLDYYTRTAFEVISEHLGAQDALAGGGRYDGLAEQIGGQPVPGVGFGAGMERLINALEDYGLAFPDRRPLDVFLVSLGDAARLQAGQIVRNLREVGVAADSDHLLSDAMKPQLTKAIARGAKYALIIGDNELAQSVVAVRDLETKEQENVPLADIIQQIRARV